MVKTKNWLIIGSVLSVLSVIFGAFGAHALRDALTPESLISYETGVRYLFFHGLAILLLCLLHRVFGIAVKVSLRLIGLGILLFSGSIFLLSTRTLLFFDPSFLGPITPIGGLLLIIGWILLGVNISKSSI